MEYKVQLLGVKEALEFFDSGRVIKATSAALNRVANSGISEAINLITDEYAIKKTDLKAYLKLELRASSSTPYAVIAGRGKGLALAKFSPRQSGRFIVYTGRGKERRGHLGSRYGRGYAGPVTELVKRSEGRKMVQGKYGNKPFLAQMKNGHIGVFVRVPGTRMLGRKKEKIEQQLRVGVAWMFGSRRVMKGTMKKIESRWPVEWKAAFNHFVAGR
jgi:hypothetical protein